MWQCAVHTDIIVQTKQKLHVLKYSAIAAIQERRILDSFHSATNGPFTRQDLIQDNTKAEDVSLLGAFADRHQLWCHPVKGPNLLQAMNDSKMPWH